MIFAVFDMSVNACRR